MKSASQGSLLADDVSPAARVGDVQEGEVIGAVKTRGHLVKVT